MPLSAYLPILRRVGIVLLVVGVLDVGFMIYAIMRGVSYSSSLNIFAIVAGLFLLRGSLRGASIIRRFAAFFLAAGISILPLIPFIWPFDLIRTSLYLEPIIAVGDGLLMAVTILVLSWVVKELGREPVQEAVVNAGLKRADIRIPALAGIAIVIILAIVFGVLTNGATWHLAESIAEKQVGPGYRFHTSSIQMRVVGGVTSYWAVVTAWNNHEIRSVPVHWVR